jgi:two-component system, NtrC family, sensor kinase
MRQFWSSLAFRIGASVVAIEVLVLVGLGVYAVSRLGEEMERRTRERIVLPGEMMQRGVLSYDSVADRILMTNLIGQELEDGLVVGANGNIFHAMNSEYLGQDLRDISGFDPSWIDNHRTVPSVMELRERDQSSLVAVTPLFVRGADVPTLFTLLKVNTTALSRERDNVTFTVVALSLFSIVLTSAIIVLMIQVTTLKRFQGLAAFVRRIGAGEKNVPALNVGRDELGRLEEGVNRMVADLDQRARQRDRAEEELRASEARFRDFAASASDWYWELDAQLRFVSISDRFFELAKPSRSPLGQTVDKLGVVPLSAGGWTELIETLTRHEPMTEFDVFWLDDAAEGGQRFARLSGLPVIDAQGGFSGYRGTGRDTTLQHQTRTLLERRVAERTAELSRANAELQDAMEDLHRAQSELVRSEKLASLGALVAGIAHEINTPVGVAVTAASHLSDRTQTMRAAVARNEIKRSELMAYIDIAEEASRLLMTNMERAAALIQSFKQVSSDRTSDILRSFDLRAYLDDIVTSLSPALRQTQHRIDIDCPAELDIVSYPGLLSQVVSNLVMNSLVHGYDEGAAGHLSIHVRQTPGDAVEIVYADDGKGIEAAHQSKVFDPFFTTRRGAGFTGLGLNIVHNIVTGSLKGQIALHSAPGRGARFTVTLPRRLTDQAARTETPIPAPV